MAKTNHDINKAYVSPFDEFLFRFDHTHQKSASQLKEIEKYERISRLRDNPESVQEEKVIWEEF